MKLLLDIGNSRLKWATTHGQGLEQPGGADYRPVGLTQVLGTLELSESPQSIWVSSVASQQARREVKAWTADRWALKPIFVKSCARACGLQNAYAQPERLGVDRWLGMIAAFNRGSGPVCVVDAGTALTIDAISAEGRHLGGLIAPGITSMRLILDERTQLTLPQNRGGLAWLARDTDSAIASGTLQSALALVERVYRRLSDDLGEPPRALLTGGEADLLQPHLLGGWTLARHLVLEGLVLCAEAEGAGD